MGRRIGTLLVGCVFLLASTPSAEAATRVKTRITSISRYDLGPDPDGTFDGIGVRLNSSVAKCKKDRAVTVHYPDFETLFGTGPTDDTGRVLIPGDSNKGGSGTVTVEKVKRGKVVCLGKVAEFFTEIPGG